MNNALIKKINNLLQTLLNQGLNELHDNIQRRYFLLCQDSFEKTCEDDVNKDNIISTFLIECRELIIEGCMYLQKYILNTVFGLYNKNLNKKQLKIRDKLIIYAFKHGNEPDLYAQFKNARNDYIIMRKNAKKFSDEEFENFYDKSLQLTNLYHKCFNNKIVS